MLEASVNEKTQASAIHNIGIIHQKCGDYAQALKCYKHSLQIHAQIGNTSGIAASLHHIGWIYQERGDYAQALDFYQHSFKIQEQIGNTSGIALSLAQMGTLWMEKEDYEQALRFFYQAYSIFHNIGSRYDQHVLNDIRRIADQIGLERAQTLIEQWLKEQE